MISCFGCPRFGADTRAGHKCASERPPYSRCHKRSALGCLMRVCVCVCVNIHGGPRNGRDRMDGWIELPILECACLNPDLITS